MREEHRVGHEFDEHKRFLMYGRVSYIYLIDSITTYTRIDLGHITSFS